MSWLSRISVFDAVAAVIAAVAIGLPRPELEAADPHKPAMRATIAAAEALTVAAPTPGAHAIALEAALIDAGHRDLAIAITDRLAKQAPTDWRAALAASVARADLLDARTAFDWSTQALTVCSADANCQPWDRRRIASYRAHLEAGLASGIDPKQDPDGFRRAGETGMRLLPL